MKQGVCAAANIKGSAAQQAAFAGPMTQRLCTMAAIEGSGAQQAAFAEPVKRKAAAWRLSA
ncbi:hypothetical protein M493_14710 [Geobacillus genomosp. 3]|uniref:Uncharacterized protein n=1 Tax=Geobacillus genomosp. 3 TaxID=1921421 RepID=S5ZFQ1_GEOG3|nr:hypothetical protein M493_14710 [Geobacillus genomosp. 3]